MTVFIFNIKRILNRKREILTMYIAPIIISLLVTQISFDSRQFKVAVINYDNTPLTDVMIKSLSSSYEIEYIHKNEINDKILSKEIEYAFVIHKGFTKEIIHGNVPKVEAFYDKEDSSSKLINLNISSFIHMANTAAVKAKKNSSVFYKNINKLMEKKNLKVLQLESNKKRDIYLALKFLVVFMIYNAFSMTRKVMGDKEEKLRFFAAPITVKNYMLQNIFTLFILEISQVIVNFAVLILQYKSLMLNYVLELLLLYSVFSITAVALALFFNYISKIFFKANIIEFVVIVPLVMLGGCFWDVSVTPKVFQYIAQFIPTTWIVKATKNVLEQKSYTAIVADLSVLLLFSLVFLLLGVITKKDIVN